MICPFFAGMRWMTLNEETFQPLHNVAAMAAVASVASVALTGC
jgi:hypothetical protein